MIQCQVVSCHSAVTEGSSDLKPSQKAGISCGQVVSHHSSDNDRKVHRRLDSVSDVISDLVSLNLVIQTVRWHLTILQ